MNPRVTGVVTVVGQDRFCVGRPAAQGDCFLAGVSILRGLQIGRCVTVDWLGQKGGETLRQISGVGEVADDPTCAEAAALSAGKVR